MRFLEELDFTDDDDVGGSGGVVVRLLLSNLDDGDSGGVTMDASIFPLTLFVYGGGGGR